MKINLQLFTPLILLILIGPGLFGAAYRWNGAGVSGGTELNTWATASNWQEWDGVDWVTATTIPGSGDTVSVTFNATTALDFALVIPEGSVAGDVLFTGLATNENRQVSIEGDTAFNSLEITSSGSTANQYGNVSLSPDATLTLSEGSALTPTLKVANTPSTGAGRLIITGDGLIELSGASIFYQGGSMVDTTVTVSNSNATIEVIGGLMSVARPLTIHPDQTFTGLTSLNILGDLISSSGNPLNQFGEVIVNFAGIANAGAAYSSDLTLSGGTYGALFARSLAAGASSLLLTQGGNLTLDGLVTNEGVTPGPEDPEYAIYIHRNRTNGALATITTAGYDLTTTSNGTVRIGDTLASANASRSTLNLNSVEVTPDNFRSSTVTIAGDFHLGSSGLITADELTVMHLRGNYFTESILNTFHNTSAMTLILDGEGTALNPQFLEVGGSDLGTHAPGDLPNNNFAFGHLQIGQNDQLTYVQLTDIFDFDDILGDALYVSSLTMMGGSTLNLDGQKLYVDGVLLEGGENYGNGFIIIPEWKFFSLAFPLVLLAGILCKVRNTKTSESLSPHKRFFKIHLTQPQGHPIPHRCLLTKKTY